VERPDAYDALNKKIQLICFILIVPHTPDQHSPLAIFYDVAAAYQKATPKAGKFHFLNDQRYKK
jgi:hypothetical protein